MKGKQVKDNIMTLADARKHIASCIENCFAEAEANGFETACWKLISDIADFADCDYEHLMEKYDF